MANGREGERHPAGDARESTAETTAELGDAAAGATASDATSTSTPTDSDSASSVDSRARTTRRSLLRAGAAASASALALGGTASAEHNDGVSPADRDVNGDSCIEWGGGELSSGDAMVLVNDWATGGNCDSANTEMCISTYGDGSFGWEWARHETCIHGEDLPNYPQALMGQKIGATSSGWRGLPQQVSDIERLDVQLDVDQDISDGEWNFMLEWWMDRGSISSNPIDEILIVLDDSQWHDKGEYEDQEAFVDAYGNTIGYWENDIEGGEGADWNFHIFKCQTDGIPSHIDLRSVLDYLVEDPDGYVADGGGTYDGSKLVSGVEVGNETWDHTDGETIVDQFNVRVQTTDGRERIGTAGVENSWSEPENVAPGAPSNLSVDATDESSVSLSWSAASDPDGSVDHYEVTETGTDATTTATGTNVTVDGLDSGVGYQFTVVAVDDEGAASPPSDSVAATTDGGLPEPCEGAEGDAATVDGQTVCDVNDDGSYRDVTGDGSVGQGDVAEFFGKQHRDAWKQPDLFDFSGNGDVTHGDVVELADHVALN